MRLVPILAAALIALAQPIEYRVPKEGILQERLKLAHPKNQERYWRLKALFDETGCRGDAFREQAVKGSKQPNLICAVVGTGESPRKIVVGAHFDCTGGDGVVDNWSGAILLPSLSQFLRESPHRHTFEFVGFAAEENGLLGSSAYLKSIAKPDRKLVAAVITMDSLGLGPPMCWPNGSTKELITAARIIAQAVQVKFGGVNVDAVGTTDSENFLRARMPVLSLHSVTQATWRKLNTREDVWRLVSWKDYYDTHRLLSALLVYLDRNLP